MRALITMVLMSMIFISCSPAFAKYDQSIHIDYSLIHSVYDGDTFTINIPEFPAIFGEALPIRINGIDTPEMVSHCQYPKERNIESLKAKEARDYVKARLSNAKTITLANVARDKYFRVLADVYVDGASLGDELVAKHMANPYDGGTKLSWCGQ